MSHVCGRVVNVGTRLGPDTAAPTSGAGFWELLFTPSPALSGGDPRFVLLHFNNMALPAGSRLEVDPRLHVQRRRRTQHPERTPGPAEEPMVDQRGRLHLELAVKLAHRRVE
jgi:hypothetical protein